MNNKNTSLNNQSSKKKKHEIAIHDFWDGNEKIPKINLPWSSIELVFNSKNIWVNLQHQNPAHIMYELFDSTSWCPFLTVSQEEEEEPWLSKVGTFYHMSNMKPPLSINKIRDLERKIYKEIIYIVTKNRSGTNLITRWKK